MTTAFRLPLLLLLFTPAVLFAAEPNGEHIYKTQCARCHGGKGEGTKRYKSPLQGDRSIAQLAEQIQKTMPDDAPGTLSAAEAKAVAAFIHGAFYSSLARERNRPARVEMARLTVRQYRQCVADLVADLRWQPRWPEQRGLKGEYFKNRRMQPRDRVLERLDPQVNFDFGTEGPAGDKTDPHEFSIRWTGSLLAPVTGEYQFILHTEHAARLFLNDTRVPLIDAWVKSGNDTEYKGSLFLIAGRIYPLRLEYSKAKQGVDDSAKLKGKKRPAVKSSMKLLWQLPHRAIEPVPARNLAPSNAPEVYVCPTPFPPDDRSYGWERGTSISREWDQASTEAALHTANYLAERLNELAGVGENAPNLREKLLARLHTLAERAFRQPLSAEQKQSLNRQFALASDPKEAVKRVVLLILKSPRFLYREVGGAANDYEVAARLSFGLLDSIPDQPLWAAAAAGQLKTPEQVRQHAERLLADPRAQTKLREFLLTWVKADQEHDLARDEKRYPGFNAAVISDLRTSLELFLEEILRSSTADYRQLLLADYVYLNGRLANYYGVNLPADAPFQKVRLDDGKRAGVLSHPYLMACFAHSTESSPIHRGVYLARGILGVALRSPPEAVAPLAPDLHPNLTTRERVVLQTSPNNCMTCHGVINPLGFTLEHFDAVGRYRTTDKGKPIDATGTYQTREGKVVQVNGARELAEFVVGSPESQGSFVEQLFHHLVQQPIRAYGQDTQEQLRQRFVADNFHIRKLAVEILVRAALKSRSEGDSRSTTR